MTSEHRDSSEEGKGEFLCRRGPRVPCNVQSRPPDVEGRLKTDEDE